MNNTLTRYKTEIVIPDDRFIAIQLPDALPRGRAVVIVECEDPLLLSASDENGDESDLDGNDIEWWDDFDESTGGD